VTGVLITFNFAAFALLSWVFFGGYSIGASVRMSSHILLALLATGLIVFSHSMTMMYFAATGRMIREAVEKAGLDGAYVLQTKGYRKRVFRIATLAMLIVMAHTILGGGAHTHVFPIWVHHVLAIVTILFSAYAVVVETRLLIQNHLLGHHVARLFEAKRRQEQS
jgi:hypothetical protein